MGEDMYVGLTRKDLAAALGVSEQLVSVHAKRGMPTHSVAAAIAWRRHHLDPTRTRHNRLDGNPGIQINGTARPELVARFEQPASDGCDALAKAFEEDFAKILSALFSVAFVPAVALARSRGCAMKHAIDGYTGAALFMLATFNQSLARCGEIELDCHGPLADLLTGGPEGEARAIAQIEAFVRRNATGPSSG